MITIHWQDKELEEIWSNMTLPSRGQLIIRVMRGSKNFLGYAIRIFDPFNVIISEHKIPEIRTDEFYDIRIPLSNHLVHGDYKILVFTPHDKLSQDFHFVLSSRRKHTQIFVKESTLVLKNMKGNVKSIELVVEDPASSFFTQQISSIIKISRGETDQSKVFVNNLLGKNQMTIRWYRLFKPAYLAIDTQKLMNSPDEYYSLQPQINYDDETGLEISHLDLSQYGGSTDIRYPMRVVTEVIRYVHSQLRYVRQQKERGLLYALKYGRGDCTEYSAFVVSLLRKIGMKAKLVSGMGRSNSNNWISHAYVKFFAYGVWIPVDVVRPVIPYVQIGNRGDLIQFTSQNWLDNTYFELPMKIMSRGKYVPKIDFSRKVIESKLKKSKVEELLTNSFNTQKQTILGYEIIGDYIKIKNIPSKATNLSLILGTKEFGTIVYMTNATDNMMEPGHERLQQSFSGFIVAVNESGFVLGSCDIEW